MKACAGMAEAHGLGIIHRDLKPSNLFLCRQGTGTPLLKVLDFGISKILADTQVNVTATQVSVGTPLYMSPEQVRSSKTVDARSDIWALGVILYELLAGQPPFMGTATAAIAAIVADETPSLKALRPDIPDELEAIVYKLLEKDAALRFQTVQELADALAPYTTMTVAMPRHSVAPSRPSWSDIPESPALVSPPVPRPIVARDPDRDARPPSDADDDANDEAPPRPPSTLLTGPLARFRFPKARSALLLGVGVLVLPMLTLASLSRNEPKGSPHVLSEGIESPHYSLGESPALPSVRVRSTESPTEPRPNPRRDRAPVQVVAAPVPPPAPVRAPRPPNENPLYL
jgi:serine/threonine-protein kinase